MSSHKKRIQFVPYLEHDAGEELGREIQRCYFKGQRETSEPIFNQCSLHPKVPVDCERENPQLHRGGTERPADPLDLRPGSRSGYEVSECISWFSKGGNGSLQ